ncbi:hypothetical protein [Clostridium uliginosum]|uniref:DUF3784 domain-containing protein n=1 Tax=Clostridium uliginosum TaxID=119641 RepID=A0A1I1ITW6_9CLOT|nr:hypothetical protein [Clostridium uliginosum]SFC39749.1 hypothetical protein SAMN05421842_10377 [Clostridium uliginosum]
MRILTYIILMLSIFLIFSGASLVLNFSPQFNSFILKIGGFESLNLSKSIKIIAIDRFVLGIFGIIFASIMLIFNNNLSTNFQFMLVFVYVLVIIIDKILLSRLK